MDRLLDGAERAIVPLLAVLLAFITVGVFVQVVLRYAFGSSFLWGEELSLFAFIWCVYLGAAVCVRRRSHFAVDVFATMLSGRPAIVQRLLVDIVVLTVAGTMLVEGWTFSQLSIQRLSPALGISLLIPTIVIPASGALMIAAAGSDVARGIRDLIWHRER